MLGFKGTPLVRKNNKTLHGLNNLMTSALCNIELSLDDAVGDTREMLTDALLSLMRARKLLEELGQESLESAKESLPLSG
ncbi:MAG: hypothetical protein COB53_09245 [Elusimicrobia bacterium]|nr:MAG: hypothetical protein COB53_09245 [Elusimicrobiota bacterium]